MGYLLAWVVELVYTGDLKSPAFGIEGSSPSPGTSSALLVRIEQAENLGTGIGVPWATKFMLSSTMVVHPAVNRKVVGSNPT